MKEALCDERFWGASQKEASETVGKKTHQKLWKSPVPTRRLPQEEERKEESSLHLRKPRPQKARDAYRARDSIHRYVVYHSEVPTVLFLLWPTVWDPVEKVREKMKHILETGWGAAQLLSLVSEVDGKQRWGISGKNPCTAPSGEEKEVEQIVVWFRNLLGLKRESWWKLIPQKSRIICIYK